MAREKKASSTKKAKTAKSKSDGSTTIAKTNGAKQYSYQGRKITLAPEQIFDVTGHVKSTKVIPDDYGGASVILVLKGNMTKALEDFTERNLDQEVGLVYNSRIVSVAIVREPLSGGMVMLSGGYSLEDAKDIALKLSGK